TAASLISYRLVEDLSRLRRGGITPLRIVLAGNEIGADAVGRFVLQNPELIQTVSGILLLNPTAGTPHPYVNRTGPRRLSISHGRKSDPAELNTKLLQGFSDLFSAVPRRCVVTLIVKEVSELLVMGNWAEAVRERAADRRLLEKCSAGIDLVSLVESIFGALLRSDDEGPPDDKNRLGARAGARLSEIIAFLTKNGANSTSFVFITESLSHSLAPSVGDLSIRYAVINDPLASTPAQQANRTEGILRDSVIPTALNWAWGSPRPNTPCAVVGPARDGDCRGVALTTLLAVLGRGYGETATCHILYLPDGKSFDDSALFDKHKEAFFGYLAGRKKSSRAAEVNAACGEIHFDMLLPPHPQRR
ncbi:hypothetical protein FOZ62_028377, partial [Perkinsus olseni]